VLRVCVRVYACVCVYVCVCVCVCVLYVSVSAHLTPTLTRQPKLWSKHNWYCCHSTLPLTPDYAVCSCLRLCVRVRVCLSACVCMSVRTLIQRLLDSPEYGVSTNDIGVIAPYRKQVQKIRLLLRKENLGAVRVGTVDDYQGRHCLCVVGGWGGGSGLCACVCMCVKISAQFLWADRQNRRLSTCACVR